MISRSMGQNGSGKLKTVVQTAILAGPVQDFAQTRHLDLNLFLNQL
jgi:hypothetical protein